MNIRKAEFADIPALLAIGARGHAKSDAAHLAFDPKGAQFVAAACMTSKERCAFVAEQADKIVGVLLGQEQSYGYLKAKYATDIVFFAELPGAGAKLMRRFLEWALEERRVHQVLLAESFGKRDPKKGIAFYNRLGARHVGGMYVIDRRTP